MGVQGRKNRGGGSQTAIWSGQVADGYGRGRRAWTRRRCGPMTSRHVMGLSLRGAGSSWPAPPTSCSSPTGTATGSRMCAKPSITGFKVNTIERGINNPIWGLDGWIYVGSGSGRRNDHGAETQGAVRTRRFGLPDQGGRLGDRACERERRDVRPDDERCRGSASHPPGGPPPGMRSRCRATILPAIRTWRPRAQPRGRRTTVTVIGSVIRTPGRVKRGRDPAWVKFYGQRETNSNYFSGGCSTTFYGGRLFPEQYHGNLFLL